MDKMKLQGIVSLLNKFPTLRKMILPGRSVALCSMGGVGSTALGRHIGSIADKTVREHAYSPEVYDNDANLKLGYMFGNPYNSILSVFRRDYQAMNVEAMNVNSPTPAADLKGVDLETYLKGGVDAFNLNRQLTNWSNPDLVKHPTILIKYEELAGNIDQVLAFFECNKPFEFKARKCSFEQQPDHIKAGLESIYGDFKRRVDAMPGVTILYPETSRNKAVKEA